MIFRKFHLENQLHYEQRNCVHTCVTYFCNISFWKQEMHTGKCTVFQQRCEILPLRFCSPHDFPGANYNLQPTSPPYPKSYTLSQHSTVIFYRACLPHIAQCLSNVNKEFSRRNCFFFKSSTCL